MVTDCIMHTQIFNILQPFEFWVPCLNRKFGGSGNLLDVLMQGVNSCENGFIADIHNLAKVWVAESNI